MNPRDQAQCAALGAAAKAGLGLDYRQDLGALDAGVLDATRGRLQGDSRLQARHCPATYALGYALGRYCLGACLGYLDGRGDSGRRTWAAFQASREGRAWAATWRADIPDALDLEAAALCEERLRRGQPIPGRIMQRIARA